jgi:hypothetical protein
MDRATRDKFASGTDQTDVTTGNACWETAPAVFRKLHNEYGFDIDLFADKQRALMPIWLGPGSEYAEDALTVPWTSFGSVGFWNCPYGAFIAKAVAKAIEEAREGFRSLGLIPLRMTKPVRRAIFESGMVEEWLFPDKRLTFFENGKPRLAYDKKTGLWKPTSALFDSTILVFGPDAPRRPIVKPWTVPDHVPAEFKKGVKRVA